jgi:uncharacterized protein (DUF58 family)
MISEEIRKKIKKIQIHTKRIMQTTITGDYLSAFKGSGLEFDQIREYAMGDDVRAIDWNSSAKMNKIMVKQFIEERDRTIILAIDISASGLYSSQQELRRDLIAQVSAVLAYISGENKDKVGALFYTDKVEKWIPPSRGRAHNGKILETIFTIQPKGHGTDTAQALKFLISIKKRNSVVFMLSDWIDDLNSYSKLLKVAGCEYDFIGVRITDPCEKHIPDIGFIDVLDPETGQTFILDTRQAKFAGAQKSINSILASRQLEQKRLFDKNKIDLLDLTIGHPFVNSLINFFQMRIRRQV